MARVNDLIVDVYFLVRALVIWGLLLGQPVLWVWALWPLPLDWPVGFLIIGLAGVIGCIGEIIWRTKIRPESGTF